MATASKGHRNGHSAGFRLVDAILEHTATLKLDGHTLTVKIMEVTPEIAQSWIPLNVQNRPLSEATVKRYAAMMANKKWILNGEAIVFDEDGKLRNGQHRLHGCIRSGESFVTLVVSGVSQDAFATFDRPKVRSSADVLAIDGHVNCIKHAAALGHLWRHLHGSHTSVAPIEPSTIAELNRQHPKFVESVRVGDTFRNLVSAPIPAVCHYLFTRQDPDRAAQFFEGVVTGLNLKETSPMWHLRNRLVNERAAVGRVPASVILALFFKAWNAYRDNKPMRSLTWRYKGEHPEAFPSID